jgi:hypothetical protein
MSITIVLTPEQVAAVFAQSGAAPSSTPVKPGARAPLTISNEVPRAWSPEVAAMKQRDYIAHLGGKLAPVTPLSAQQALVSYANRPEASDYEYATIRDRNMLLANKINVDEAYGITIPYTMRTEQAIDASYVQVPGFLPGEKA